MLQQKQVNIEGKVFNIIKLISSINQGTVYKGTSQEGEEVIIKHQNAISDTEYKIFLTLKQNPKDHIIAIKAIEKDTNGNTFIVMELANEDLYTYMTNNPEFQTLQKDQRNQIFYQLVEAIKELHELGYFHRDVNPVNFGAVRNDANGYVKTKLISLGLCKQKNKINIQNVGTPYYMAPETINGSQFYDHKVDSWALGCIWFEIITGEKFFASI